LKKPDGNNKYVKCAEIYYMVKHKNSTIIKHVFKQSKTGSRREEDVDD